MAEQLLDGKVAFVSGASRGIGREIALKLVEAGAHVVGNSVDPKKNRRVEEVKRLGGGKIEWVYGDITSPDDRGSMIATTRALAERIRPGKPTIDYVYLNAAGGLETDKPDGWPHVVNVTSQIALAEGFAQNISPGGAIVNITSLWSTRFGQVEQLPSYRPVAKSKYRGEQELRNMIDGLSTHEIRVLFLSGNLIQGTGAFNIFKRVAPGLIDQLRHEYQQQTGVEDFPHATDMGQAAVDLVAAKHPSGHTEYVGNMELAPIPAKQRDPYKLDRNEISAIMPMYGTKPPYNKLYVDEFHSPAEDRFGDAKETGTGFYVVRRADTAGHFTGAHNRLRLYRGVDEIEMVAQVGGLVVAGLESASGRVPLFTDIEDGGVHWRRMVEPGDPLKIEARITGMNPFRIRVAGEVYTARSGKLVSDFSGLTFALAPSLEYVMNLREEQRASK